MEKIMKPVMTAFIKDGEYEVTASDLREVLEDLEGCNGFGSAMVIYDKDVEKYLENNNVITRTARGSYMVADEEKRKIMLEKVYKTLYEK